MKTSTLHSGDLDACDAENVKSVAFEDDLVVISEISAGTRGIEVKIGDLRFSVMRAFFDRTPGVYITMESVQLAQQ